MHHQRLIGRTAIVTGAGRGIGRAIARAYAAEGARVALVSRTHDELEQLATEIRAAGGDALCFTCDVRDSAAVNTVVDAVVAQWGTIDALVNAAGIPMVSPTVELSDERWQQALDINLNGTFYFCRAVGAVMLQHQFGTIVNIVPHAPAAIPHTSTNRCPKRSIYRPAIGVTTADVRYTKNSVPSTEVGSENGGSAR